MIDSRRNPPPPEREPRAGNPLPLLLAGLFCGAAGIASPWLLDRSLFRKWFHDDLVAECAANHDGDPGFVTTVLERERWRFIGNAKEVLLLIAVGFIVTALITHFRGRSKPRWTLLPWILAALAAATFELGGQCVLAWNGGRDGLFTEDREARDLRYFDAAVAPARIVIERVPEDARIVVIDFADPQVVKKFGYLVYPRRVFMPPRLEFRFSAGTARQLLHDMPHGIDWCFENGYTHLVDLKTLERDRDPNAIIDLRGIPR